MCDELMPISQDCESVSGGLVGSIYVAYRKDVANIPAPVALTGAIADNVTMVGSAVFVPVQFVEDNGSFKEDSVGDPGFRKLKTTIMVVLKGQKAQVNRHLNRILNGSFVLIWTDAEGQQWIAGNPKKGFQVSHKKDSGMKGDDNSKVEVTWELTSKEGAVAYNGAIPLAD